MPISAIYNYRGFFFVIVTSIFLLCVALNFNDWAYDEYAAVTSHLELDDPRMISTYHQLITSTGIPTYLNDNVISPLLSILVVPLRWTYAIGISPLYAIVRIDALSWETTKLILHIFHSIISFIGLVLIYVSLPKDLRGTTVPALCSLILLSSPFVYWLGTFTSYSYHLICFGLLLYEFTWTRDSRILYFGRSTLIRTMVVMLNYQYIFYLVLMGIIELNAKRARFFNRGLYKSWIMPGVISLISVCFVYIRLFFGDHEVAPALNYPEAQDLILSFDGSAGGLVNFLQILASRSLDIAYYFYSGYDRDYFILQNFSSLSVQLTLLLLSTVIFGGYFVYKACSDSKAVQRILRLCFIMLGGQILLYIFGILPMSPSRHSLVIFLPSVVLLVLAVHIIYSKVFDSKLWLQRLVTAGFVIALISSGKHFFVTPVGTDSKTQVDCLLASSVEKIVLDACFYEPLLQNKGNEEVRFLYSCGSHVIASLNEHAKTVAFLSRETKELSYTKEELAKYSSSMWKSDDLALASLSSCLSGNEGGNNKKKEAVKISLFDIVE